jgi:hypothetical protein
MNTLEQGALERERSSKLEKRHTSRNSMGHG